MSWFATSDYHLLLATSFLPLAIRSWTLALGFSFDFNIDFSYLLCCRSALIFRSRRSRALAAITAIFLAGPLGFEPRQSAPQALDLPLVGGPTFFQALRRERLCPRLGFAQYGAHHSPHLGFPMLAIPGVPPKQSTRILKDLPHSSPPNRRSKSAESRPIQLQSRPKPTGFPCLPDGPMNRCPDDPIPSIHSN